jgi:hypothetical protein
VINWNISALKRQTIHSTNVVFNTKTSDMDKTTEIIISTLILPIVKDLIAPKIKLVIDKFSITNLDESKLEDNFETYLTQRYEKFLVIDTLVFPNKQTLLDTLYQPLTLKGQNCNNDDIEILVNGYPQDLIPEYFRVIIEDTAGMGKSTISKKLFLSIVREKSGIPVLIELSQINPKNSILKEIQNQISPIGKKVSQELILKILNEGGFIFLFDGFDEISLDNREYAIRELHRFIEKANDNYFLITSRPEDSLTSFGDFQKFKVKHLEKGEAYSLLSKYDSYSYKPIATKLIKQLNDNPQDSLQEYLHNPFLVSLLYKSYEYKKDIPVKKSQFYQQVYDALFETHDLSKEGYLKRDKYSNLHIDDFERVIRYMAYFTSIDNVVEYDKNGIIKYIDRAKKHLTDLSFRSSDFLKDLLKTVPIFKKEGNYFKWGHKSLQDYFAAKWLWIDAKESQEKILNKIYNDSQNKRFYNLLDLFFELDQTTFNKTILKWLLDDFVDYTKNSYKYYGSIDSKLKKRFENSFNKKCTIVISKPEDFEIIRTGGRKLENSRELHRAAQRYYSSKVKQSFDHTTYHYFESPEVVALNYIDFGESKDTIIKLLSKRVPELAENRRHDSHKKELIELKSDNKYILSDEESNILNKENMFDLTSDLIKSDCALKYDTALKKHKQLTTLIKSKSDNEFLDW